MSCHEHPMVATTYEVQRETNVGWLPVHRATDFWLAVSQYETQCLTGHPTRIFYESADGTWGVMSPTDAAFR
jgi:hypothetical protein